MMIDAPRTIVLGLNWQTNVVRPGGPFGEPTEVAKRAARFHAQAREAGAGVFLTKFGAPGGEASTTPDLIAEMAEFDDSHHTIDNLNLEGEQRNELIERTIDHDITTVLITGVATNLSVEQAALQSTVLGFTVHVISDCVAAATPELHSAALEALDLDTAGCLTADAALARLQ